ncbi:unnamed protein product [Closterium sp. NIES-53]
MSKMQWPQVVRYAAHQLNLRPSDARPWVTPVFLWTDASRGVFYNPLTYHFFNSQDATFDESDFPVVSAGVGGAAAEAEGSGAAGACGVGSRGTGGVRVETILVEDTTVLTWRPRPDSPPDFLSVPQFPPRSTLRPVATEPGGVLLCDAIICIHVCLPAIMCSCVACVV